MYVAINQGDGRKNVYCAGKEVFRGSASQYGGVPSVGSTYFAVNTGNRITYTGTVEVAIFYPGG